MKRSVFRAMSTSPCTLSPGATRSRRFESAAARAHGARLSFAQSRDLPDRPPTFGSRSLDALAASATNAIASLAALASPSPAASQKAAPSMARFFHVHSA